VIAFFQWRIKFPPACNKTSKYKLQELITDRVEWINDHRVNVEEQVKSTPHDVNDRWYQRYKLNTDSNKPSLIKSFHQIGMQDPFPNEKEDQSRELSDTDDVYPPYKYIEGVSPNVIFIPCNKVLFKLMRACIGMQFE